MQNIKLNIFQRGLASHVLIIGTYFSIFFLGLYLLDIVEKDIILKTLQKAIEQEIITEEIYKKLKYYIDTRDINEIAPILEGIVVVVGAILLILPHIASYNITWPVTLPDAIEFRPAMKKLGILSLSDEIAFITKHKVQIFIAIKPFIKKEEEQNVRARLYPFARNNILMMLSVFEKAIGARKLCISKQAYEYLLNESQAVVSIKESSIIMEKDKEVEVCNTKITYLSKEIEELENKNTLLQAENTSFKNKQKTEGGRGKVEINRARRQRIQWMAINALLERITIQSPANKIYTEREIKNLLDVEWQNSRHLQDEMEKLCNKRELNLSQTMLDAAKGCLADTGHFNSTGGRPTKHVKRPI